MLLAVHGTSLGHVLHAAPAPGQPCILDPGLICIGPTDWPCVPDPVCKAGLVWVSHAGCILFRSCTLVIACPPDWSHTLHSTHEAGASTCCTWNKGLKQAPHNAGPGHVLYVLPAPHHPCALTLACRANFWSWSDLQTSPRPKLVEFDTPDLKETPPFGWTNWDSVSLLRKWHSL